MSVPTHSFSCSVSSPRIEQPAKLSPLIAISLATLLPSLGTSIANVSLPTLAAAFQVPFALVQWVVVGYLLAVTALIVGVGKLGDLLGRRRLLLTGITVFTLASIAAGCAAHLWQLNAARIVQGLGAAIMMALTLAFVGDTIPKARAGRAMGLLGSMSAIGTALGPSLGGFLIAGWGWRAIFFVMAPLGLFSVWAAARSLPADPPSTSTGQSRFDYTGTGLLALSLASYALAMTLGRGHLGPLNLGLLLFAAVVLILFVGIERKSPNPLLHMELLWVPHRRTGLLLSALVSTVIMTTLVIGPFYLSGALGLNPTQVGLILSVGPLVAALTGAPAGRLVDRYGTRKITVGGLFGMAMGVVSLSLPRTPISIVGYLASIMAITAGYALFQTANNTTIMNAARSEQRGLVSGLLNLSRNLGLITGASLMGLIFSAASEPVDPNVTPIAAIVAGMRLTFGVATGLIVVAIGVELGRRLRPDAQPQDGDAK